MPVHGGKRALLEGRAALLVKLIKRKYDKDVSNDAKAMQKLRHVRVLISGLNGLGAENAPPRGCPRFRERCRSRNINGSGCRFCSGKDASWRASKSEETASGAVVCRTGRHWETKGK